jgi:hypothetical protein
MALGLSQPEQKSLKSIALAAVEVADLAAPLQAELVLVGALAGAAEHALL